MGLSTKVADNNPIAAKSKIVKGIVELTAGETGLSAYWRRDELRDGLVSKSLSEIDAYAIESLSDCDGFSCRTDGAVERSRIRRQSAASRNDSSLSDTQLADMQRLKAKLEQQRSLDVIDLDNKKHSEKSAGGA